MNSNKNKLKEEIFPLYKLGVKTDWKTGEIIVDDETLLNFIKANPDEFQEITGNLNTNIKTKAEKFKETLETEINNKKNQLLKLDDKELKTIKYLERYEKSLEKKFGQLSAYIETRTNNMYQMINIMGGNNE